MGAYLSARRSRQRERGRETHIKTVFTPNFMTAEDLPPFLPQKVEISQRNFLSLEGQTTRFIPIEVHAPKSVRLSQMYRGRGLILSGRQDATIKATSHHRSFSCTRTQEQTDNPLSGDAMLLSPLSLMMVVISLILREHSALLPRQQRSQTSALPNRLDKQG